MLVQQAENGAELLHGTSVEGPRSGVQYCCADVTVVKNVTSIVFISILLSAQKIVRRVGPGKQCKYQ